ncbi:hypothetical protein AX15_002742 [Amanita polypyramis BW_CC]|nr:hypothetical protein AX15_002742 [Amanita polypyramis BW_CC]
MSISVVPMSLYDAQLPQHMWLNIHRGALDQTLVTSEPPPRVMEQIRQILDDMGIVVKTESDFKYRCICKHPTRPVTKSFAQQRRAVGIVGEVRFSVELTRLDGLCDTFSLDVRRLRGDLRNYKVLYDTLRQRAADLL